MKIGIYLVHPPLTELAEEKSTHQLIQLVKGFLDIGDNHVIVLMPSWSRDAIQSLFLEAKVNLDRVMFLAPKGMPASLRLIAALSYKRKTHAASSRPWTTYKRKTHPSPSRPWTTVAERTRKSLERWFFEVSGRIMMMRSVMFFLLALLPFLLGFTIHACMKIILLTIMTCVKRMGIWFPSVVKGKTILQNKIRIKHAHYKHVMKALLKYFNDSFFVKETQLMAALANEVYCDIWFSPTGFWPAIDDIRNPVVLCLSDLSPMDCPVSYARKYPNIIEEIDKCLLAMQSQKFFITYGNAVKHDTLTSQQNMPHRLIFNIPHLSTSLERHIHFQGVLDVVEARETFSTQLIEGYRATHFQNNLYLRSFSFVDVSYIFLPIEIRPNNNVMNLLRAYEILLRKKHRYVKLFIIGDISVDQEVADFIHSRRLQFEVIAFIDVTEQILAALYHRANLIVNSSLFEGGLSSTFLEGLSVGTPSVQSDLPETRAFLDQLLADQMLFDPYNPEHMATVLEWGLENRAELLAMQLPYLARFQHLTWKTIAMQHFDVFNRILQQNKETHQTWENSLVTI